MTNVRSFIVGLIALILLFAGGIYVYQKSIKPTILERNAKATPTPVVKSKADATPTASPPTQTSQKTNLSFAPSTGEDPQNVGITLNFDLTKSKITSPTVLSGSANVPDSIVYLQVKDANGNILGSTKVTACMAQDACPFETSVIFASPQTATGTIEAFARPSFQDPKPYLATVGISF